MKNRPNQVVTVLLVIVALVFTGVSSYGATWEPFEFRGNESYSFEVTWQGSEGEESSIYEFRILEDKDGGYTVRFISEVKLSSSDELTGDLVYGAWSGYGVPIGYLLVNPIYSMMFGELDLKVGEKMSFYGQGRMEVIGTEKVAGKEGFLCKLTGDEGLMGEWVIDPDLALPLRSKMYESSGFDGAVELVNYERL
ncbi:MAG: hypothetical protein V5A87_02085 [Candidatus Bipolaricaulota bacterium]|nr:hypothetical protein [Candidatus Bipolaricaulota bacterium]